MTEIFKAPIEKKRRPIEIKKDKVIVMGVELPRNPEPGPRTPPAEKFKDFVEDEFSLKLLQIIAKSVYLGQPLLLEGEAAIGKSSAIEYLAYLTNNEVYRMSLNGQTDTTDLIGKWVPRSENWRQKIEELYRHPEKCKNPEARRMLESIKVQPSEKEEIAPERAEAKVGLTKEEMQRIAELEGIPISEADWVWQDGELPRQIENGAWTVLDEVNTCEPQILVRLNALLEKGGQLVLHENGDKIPKPKDPNKKPMLFATCNPPGGRYRGRIPLSAEWISRWNYQNVGELPLEENRC
jgi:midasin